MLLNLLLFTFWMLILIPSAVDGGLSVRVGAYDLKYSYFFCFISFVIFFLKSKKSLFISKIKLWFNPNIVFFALLFIGVGLFGIIHSSFPERVFLYWLWSTLTMLFVPFLIHLFQIQLNKWVGRSIIFYLLIQSLVVLIDAVICIPSEGKYHIGNVMVYLYASTQKLCRPSAFYQEPGYFCVFALLGALFTRFFLSIEKKYFHKFYFLIYIIALTAVALSLSRMGWLGVSLLVFWEIFNFSKSKFKLNISFKKNLIFFIPIFVIVFLLFTQGGLIYRYLGSPWKETDGGMMARLNSLKNSLVVFKENPLLGVGPGGTGAYILDHQDKLGTSMLPHMRNEPIAQNLYSELLSEWGLMGFIFFSLFLYLTLLQLDIKLRKILLCLLLVIYSSTQTLPRFDIWLMIGAFLSYFRTKKAIHHVE